MILPEPDQSCDVAPHPPMFPASKPLSPTYLTSSPFGLTKPPPVNFLPCFVPLSPGWMSPSGYMPSYSVHALLFSPGSLSCSSFRPVQPSSPARCRSRSATAPAASASLISLLQSQRVNHGGSIPALSMCVLMQMGAVTRRRRPVTSLPRAGDVTAPIYGGRWR